MVLVGRAEERATLDGLLRAAREGLSGAVVLRGEPGMGKTALLDYAASSAFDFRVLRLLGIESEMELGFAALHQLLVPLLGELDAVPVPQRTALRSAFGLEEAEAPDRLMVGLAALTLLAGAAAKRPLLCIVDDAQWLDHESAQALGFVARRLYADRIAMLLVLRDGTDQRMPFEGLDELHVDGLPPRDARELLDVTVARHVDDQVADHIVFETEGNPLALVQLGAELTADQLAGASVLPEPLPIGKQLEARFLRHVQALPADTQAFVLLAASERTGDPALVRRAGDLLGLDPAAASAAEADDLLTLGLQIHFRHPMIRSAVYHGAPIAERRRIHGALAAVSDRDVDAHRRAWHRAAAAVGKDEAIAEELEVVADRARRRGGYLATATFLARAAELTPDARKRSARLLAAAQADLTAGAPARALIRLEEAMPDLDDGLPRAQALRLEGAIRFALGQTAETLVILMEAAHALEPFDVRLARDTLLDALSAGFFTGRRESAGGLLEVARRARQMPLPAGAQPTSGDLLLDGLVAIYVDGHEAAAPLLRTALASLDNGDPAPDDALRWLGFGCLAAGVLGDYDALHVLATRLVRLARDHGALVALTRGLYFLSIAEVVSGSLTDASAHFLEGREIRAARGDAAGLGEMIVLAWRGDDTRARAEAAAVIRGSRERRQAGILIYAEYSLAVLELSLGSYQAALVHALNVDYEDSYFLSTLALPDLVEAAARGGDRAAATAANERLAQRATVNGTPFALGMLARSHALLADGREAEDHYLEAIRLLGESDSRGHLARAHLLYGEWLRRERRRRDAREHLRAAIGLFESMGADAFAERARVELFATGEHARKRTVDTLSELTPQEAQIARLAGMGSTNPEIASQLFISASTVDYHLRKVFRKLDVTSRRQLVGALRPGE